LTSFRKALALDPASLEAMVGLADVLSQTGRREEARAQLAQIENSLQSSPRVPPQLQTQLDAVRSALRRQVESGRAD
jgi:thioredoxin-like negative regulator of GroEL